jgi:hypothetical protein
MADEITPHFSVVVVSPSLTEKPYHTGQPIGKVTLEHCSLVNLMICSGDAPATGRGKDFGDVLLLLADFSTAATLFGEDFSSDEDKFESCIDLPSLSLAFCDALCCTEAYFRIFAFKS